MSEEVNKSLLALDAALKRKSDEGIEQAAWKFLVAAENVPSWDKDLLPLDWPILAKEVSMLAQIISGELPSGYQSQIPSRVQQIKTSLPYFLQSLIKSHKPEAAHP